MTLSSFRSALAALPALLGVLGCSSPPSQVYLLSSSVPAPAVAGAVPISSGSSQPRRSGQRQGPLVDVVVTVPEYLDRLDIMQRSGANELKPDYNAQWGEPLAVTATRALTENLAAAVPADDIVMLPTRSSRRFDYQVNLDLTRFECDAAANCVLAGRWGIIDRDGNERANGRVQRSQKAEGEGYTGMAAAMSRNLAGVSADIAAALQRLPAESVAAAAPPPRSGSSTRKTRP
jgi:uncharacterized lipoprotein YmbA